MTRSGSCAKLLDLPPPTKKTQKKNRSDVKRNIGSTAISLPFQHPDTLSNWKYTHEFTNDSYQPIIVMVTLFGFKSFMRNTRIQQTIQKRRHVKWLGTLATSQIYVCVCETVVTATFTAWYCRYCRYHGLMDTTDIVNDLKWCQYPRSHAFIPNITWQTPFSSASQAAGLRMQHSSITCIIIWRCCLQKLVCWSYSKLISLEAVGVMCGSWAKAEQ